MKTSEQQWLNPIDSQIYWRYVGVGKTVQKKLKFEMIMFGDSDGAFPQNSGGATDETLTVFGESPGTTHILQYTIKYMPKLLINQLILIIHCVIGDFHSFCILSWM